MASRRGGGHERLLPEFEWNEHNEDKLLLNHNVSAVEAEQCFANPNTRRRVGEDMLMLGITDGGRMLLLVYEQKPSGIVRVYSAREMTDNERRTYRRNAR
ncbi:MAG TPA: BrnT family toxin [Candidatus Dormibacteraeota bacterium]|nr:BrnT family toxin [Candidatus Dormibacteraeota bacterium]